MAGRAPRGKTSLSLLGVPTPGREGEGLEWGGGDLSPVKLIHGWSIYLICTPSDGQNLRFRGLPSPATTSQPIYLIIIYFSRPGAVFAVWEVRESERVDATSARDRTTHYSSSTCQPFSLCIFVFRFSLLCATPRWGKQRGWKTKFVRRSIVRSAFGFDWIFWRRSIYFINNVSLTLFKSKTETKKI